jgi:hypothetical protein
MLVVAMLLCPSTNCTTLVWTPFSSSRVAKPLAGAALKGFMTKCTKDACEPKAIDKNGKPLAGAAKASFMKKCESEA